MGCWDETCALTNTPIRHEQRCVMVLIRRGDHKRYGPFGNSHFDYRKVHGIFKGLYNDYGWIGDKCGDFLEVEECDWEDHDNRPDDKFYIVFFHRSVWDACQKFYAENKEDNWNLCLPDRLKELEDTFGMRKQPESINEFAVVCCIASTTRRDILGGCLFSGCQDWGTTGTYRFVHQQIAARFKEKFGFEKVRRDECDELLQTVEQEKKGEHDTDTKGDESSTQTTGKVSGNSGKPKKKR